MTRLLIVASTGSADATRASIPFHIAANGAAASGVECALALTGDATGLLAGGAAGSVKGIGVPPLTDLLRACVDGGVQFHV